MNTQTMNSVDNGHKIVNGVGMIIVLVSFTMLFMTLMMGFAVYRLTAPVWPPQGMVRPSLLLPVLSTLAIFFSSVSYYWYEKDLIKNAKGLLGTIILGFAFMLIQSLFWNNLHSQGIYTSTGIFASIMYAFTWIHAAHIIAALGLLLWLYFTSKKLEPTKLVIRAMNVGKFWHFLGIIWLIMFVSIFVL